MMKIIFGEQFKNDLKNSEYTLNICSFGIHTFEVGKSLKKNTVLSNLPNEIDNKDFKFQGIWEEDKKKLMLSFNYSLESYLTTNSSSPAIYCFYTEKYDNSRSKIAFVLVQEDDKNNNQFGQNKLSINKNLINIDFSGLDIEAKLITAQSENTSFLEKDNVNLGCSVFLANKRELTQEEREETIVTKESYRRYLLRSKCKENPIGDFNLGRDFLTTNDGEKIYRNTTYRVYNPYLFIPKLSGDLVTVISEKTTTTERPTLAPPNYKDDEMIDADLGETTSSSTTTTDMPTLDNNSSSTSKKPDSIVIKPDEEDDDLGDTSTTQINSSAIPVVRSRAAIEEHPNILSPDEENNITEDPNKETSTTSKPGDNNQENPEIIYEYNTFGIGCSSGKIDITGIIGYTDYSIKNNISKIKRTGYQDISDLPNIIIEKEKVRKPNSLEYYDEIWAGDVKVIGKSIEYPEMTNGNDVRCNYINVSIQSVDHTGKLITCKKQFKIKQSNDYDNPWVQLDGIDWEEFKIDKVCYYSTELENSGTGLIKSKIPVIVFYEDAEDIDYSTELDPYTITTWDKDTINAIETVGLDYEYSYLNGYESSEDPREMFFKFFDFKEISVSDLKEDRNKYLIIGKDSNTGKEVSWSLRFGLKPKKLNEIFNEDLEGRFDRWHPYDDPKDEGVSDDNKQLIIKTTIRLSLPKGYEVLKGTNKFETSFIVIKEPKKKSLNLYKGRYGYDDYEKIEDSIILSKQYDNSYSSDYLQLLTDDNSKLEFTDNIVNGWAIINNNGIALNSKDYGVMLRPSEYNETPEFEYSDPFVLSSSITEDYKFDPIKFIYLNGHIFGTNDNTTVDKITAVKKMIDSIGDINSWKVLALCPKVELNIEKDKSVKVSHKKEEVYFSLTDSKYNPIIESNRFDVTVQDPNFELFTIETTDPFIVNIKNIKQELTFLDENGVAVQDGATYSEGSYKFYARVDKILTEMGADTYGELIIQSSYKDRSIIVGVKNSDYILQRDTEYYPIGTSQLNEYNTIFVDNNESSFEGYYQIITSNLPEGEVIKKEDDVDYGITLVGEDSNVFLDSKLISEIKDDTLSYRSTEVRVEGTVNNNSYPKYPLANPSKLIKLEDKYLYIFNGTSPKFYDSFGNYSKNISINITTRTDDILETTLYFLSEYPIYLRGEQNNYGIVCEMSSNDLKINQDPVYSLAIGPDLEDNFNLTKTITDRLAYSIEDFSDGKIIPYKFTMGDGSVSVAIPPIAPYKVVELGKIIIKQQLTKLSREQELDVSNELCPNDLLNINFRLFVHPVISLVIDGLEYKPNGLNTTTSKDTNDITVYNTTITYPNKISYLGQKLNLCIEKPHNNCLSSVPSNVILGNNLNNNPKLTLNKSSIFGSLEIPKIPEIENYLNKLPEPLNYSEFDNNVLNSLLTTQTETYKFELSDTYQGNLISDYKLLVDRVGVEKAIRFKYKENDKLYFKNSDTTFEIPEVDSETEKIEFSCQEVFINDFLEGDEILIEETSPESINTLIINDNGNFTIEFGKNRSINSNRVFSYRIYNSTKEIAFNLRITQKIYKPIILIDGRDILTENVLIGFHSSGKCVNTKEFGILSITTSADIYDKVNNKILLSGNDFDNLVIGKTSNLDGTVTYKLQTSILPNYTDKGIEGTLTLSTVDNKVHWLVNYLQGFISTRLVDNENFSDIEYSVSKVDNKYIGYVGSEDNPIPYPSTSANYKRYFSVSVYQQEPIIKDGIITLGEELKINSSNDSISTKQKSSPQYTIISYQSSDWSNGKYFKEGYDTDLYYSSDNNYPRLVHKYNVRDKYINTDFVFSMDVKFCISRYKKYLYDISESDNLITDVQNFNTTPFNYRFYLKKTTPDTNIPIILGFDSIKFDKSGGNILVPIKITNSNFSINNLQVSRSDRWIDYEILETQNTNEYNLNITVNEITDVSENSIKPKEGRVTLSPTNLDEFYWDGEKHISVYQSGKPYFFDYSDKTLEYTWKDTSKVFETYLSIGNTFNKDSIKLSNKKKSDWVNIETILTDKQAGWRVKVEQNNNKTERISIKNELVLEDLTTGEKFTKYITIRQGAQPKDCYISIDFFEEYSMINESIVKVSFDNISFEPIPITKSVIKGDNLSIVIDDEYLDKTQYTYLGMFVDGNILTNRKDYIIANVSGDLDIKVKYLMPEDEGELKPEPEEATTTSTTSAPSKPDDTTPAPESPKPDDGGSGSGDVISSTTTTTKTPTSEPKPEEPIVITTSTTQKPSLPDEEDEIDPEPTPNPVTTTTSTSTTSNPSPGGSSGGDDIVPYKS